MKNASDSLQETEANLFSAFILMPDVVLLSKIYFRRDSFQMLLKDLTVSAEALEYRLRIYLGIICHYRIKKLIMRLIPIVGTTTV